MSIDSKRELVADIIRAIDRYDESIQAEMQLLQIPIWIQEQEQKTEAIKPDIWARIEKHVRRNIIPKAKRKGKRKERA